MPWKTFNLDSNASERDLKRAYARLLKKHRPDRDPEGFARINKAYEQAKFVLSLRHEQPVEPGSDEAPPLPALPPLNHGFYIEEDVADTETAISSSTVDLPEEFYAHRASLREAISSGDAFGMDAALQALNRLCVDRLDLIPHWGMAIAEDFWDNQGFLARRMPRDDLLRELEFENNQASLAVLEGWEQNYDVEAMRGLARAILEVPDRYHNAAVAVVCVRLGTLLAIVAPRIAGELANHAFATLPPNQRFLYIDGMNDALASAEYFRSFGADQRLFWARRLASPSLDWDWNDAESAEALRYLRCEAPYNWDGFALVKDVIPPEKWGNFGSDRGQLRQHSAAPVSTTFADSTRGFSSWGCLVFLPIYLLIKMVAFGTCDSGSSSRMSDQRMEEIRSSADKLKEIWEERKRREALEDQGYFTPGEGLPDNGLRSADPDPGTFPSVPRVSDLPEIPGVQPPSSPRPGPQVPSSTPQSPPRRSPGTGSGLPGVPGFR